MPAKLRSILSLDRNANRRQRSAGAADPGLGAHRAGLAHRGRARQQHGDAAVGGAAGLRRHIRPPADSAMHRI